ncbi:hypothetical protein [Streptomyces sp. NPDC053048]|uniref:hypothetical protein n=1 Tax=Streptomyces sp. NPDC053048 TaxID=3365694 RepID=UPI0037D2EBE5
MRKLVAPLATLLLAGAAGLTFSAPAQAAPAATVPVVEQCPDVCPANYDPVFCRFSDGSTGRFTNDCFASVHACKRGVKIVACTRILN